jgi:tRNA(adenine34) deaminase
MWGTLSLPWQVCFEEAWEAYCNGSIPIGAVMINDNGEVISRGRNRINESFAPSNQTCANKLAHAEINVLLQVNKEHRINKNYTLYTTTETCVLCFGAIVMSGIRRVRYAAKDPLAGGANLNFSENSFIRERAIDIQCDYNYLGNIQRVIRTEYVIRNLNAETSKKLLKYYIIDYPEAVQLGERWFKNGKLEQARQDGIPIEYVVKEIFNEIEVS